MSKRNRTPTPENLDELTDVLGEEWDRPPVGDHKEHQNEDQEELDRLAMAYPLSKKQIENYENEKKRQKKGGRRQTKKRVRKTSKKSNKSSRKNKTKK